MVMGWSWVTVVEQGVWHFAQWSLVKIAVIFAVGSGEMDLCLLTGLDQLSSCLYTQHLVCHVDHSMPIPREGEENQIFIFSMSD